MSDPFEGKAIAEIFEAMGFGKPGADIAQKVRTALLELHEARICLMLCDPNGDRVKAFGNWVREDPEVLALCERHGFGAVMDSAARQWRMRDPSGAYTTGPAVGSVRAALGLKR